MRNVLRHFTIGLMLLSAAATAVAGTPLTIVFPDGREARITLRAETASAPGSLPPVARLTEVFARYQKMAIAGDADAASYLARGLKRCKSTFLTDEALAAAMDKLRTEGVLALPDGTTMQMKLTPEQVDTQEQTLRQELDYCRGIGQKELAALQEMNEIAAAGKGWIAASSWANSLGQSPDGAAAWEYLWSQGYRQALAHLTAMSASGRDPIRAYAYLLLNLRIAEAAQRATQDRTEAMLATRLRAASANWTSTLSIQQQAKAEDLAYEMLTRNRACCYVLVPGGF